MNGMLSPSLMCADMLNLQSEITALDNLGVEYIHLDFMDGKFVPNITLDATLIKSVKSVLKNMNFDNILSAGYSFQIEMNYSFESNGYNVKEEPIIFYERRSGQSKMSKNIIAEALFRVIRLRFRNKKRYFNN